MGLKDNFLTFFHFLKSEIFINFFLYFKFFEFHSKKLITTNYILNLKK